MELWRVLVLRCQFWDEKGKLDGVLMLSVLDVIWVKVVFWL